MTDPADSSSDGSSENWLSKNKEHAKISVVASLVCSLKYNICFHMGMHKLLLSFLLGIQIKNIKISK